VSGCIDQRVAAVRISRRTCNPGGLATSDKLLCLRSVTFASLSRNKENERLASTAVVCQGDCMPKRHQIVAPEANQRHPVEQARIEFVSPDELSMLELRNTIPTDTRLN
jgi:hypothetical protein